MNQIIKFITDNVPKLWYLLWNQKLLAYFLTFKIIDAYIIPSIRKLTGKDN